MGSPSQSQCSSHENNDVKIAVCQHISLVNNAATYMLYVKMFSWLNAAVIMTDHMSLRLSLQLKVSMMLADLV